MKLFICGWRPWTVVGRYKSLMLNAIGEGHEVLGVASEHLGVRSMTEEMFNQLDVPFVTGGAAGTTRALDEFQPDAVFGEQYWHCPEEVAARVWAREHGVPHLVLDHGKNYHATAGAVVDYHSKLAGSSTILVATERAAAILEGRTAAKIVLVGMPQYDLVKDEYWVPGIREQLGVAADQKLIALSLYFHDRGNPTGGEGECLLPFLELAGEKGWRVVCSPHPTERKTITSLRHPKRLPYLKSMQDRGVLFVSDFGPGNVGGVEFIQCPLFDLLAAADGVTGASQSLQHPAYAAGKQLFPFEVGGLEPLPNVGEIGEKFEGLIEAVVRGSEWHQDAETTREYFWKLDRMCWKRMLEEVGDGTRT